MKKINKVMKAALKKMMWGKYLFDLQDQNRNYETEEISYLIQDGMKGNQNVL